jgi:hypothetical protein
VPYNQFAPCDVVECDERRAKRRRWCVDHAAYIDSFKDRNRCTGSCRSDRGVLDRCSQPRGHPGRCMTPAEAMRQAMLSVDYLGDLGRRRDPPDPNDNPTAGP